MSGCDKYMEAVSVLIDGELDADGERELLEHLAECEDCSRLYGAFVSVSENMPRMDIQAPPGFAGGTMYRIKSEYGGAPRKGRRFAFGGFTAIAACMALVLFAVSKTGTDFAGFQDKKMPNTGGQAQQESGLLEEKSEPEMFISARDAQDGEAVPAQGEEAESISLPEIFSGISENGAAAEDDSNVNLFALDIWTPEDGEAAASLNRLLADMTKNELSAADGTESRVFVITDTDTLLKLASLISWNGQQEKTAPEGEASYNAVIYTKNGENAPVKLWLSGDRLWIADAAEAEWIYAAQGSAGEFLEFAGKISE